MKRRWKWSLGCLSLILIVFLYRVISVYEFRGGECTAETQPGKIAQTYPRRLLIMEYNIEGHAALIRSDHIQQIAAVINKIHPDIVAINEAHRNTWQARFHDHVAELQQLTHMSGAFGESYDQMRGKFGNLLLTRGRIVAVRVHHLPGAGEPRTLLETTIDIDGGRIRFFVTHLTAWEKLNRSTRITQLKCLAAHVRASPYPYILAGDLNAPPDSPEITDFASDNTMQMAGNGAGFTNRVMRLWIDYIFTDRGWKVISARPVELGPSDHIPLVAELRHETP